MSDDIFSILTEEEQAEFITIAEEIYKCAGIDYKRLHHFLFLGHKVFAYAVIEGLVERLLDFAVERWNVKAGAKSGA